MKYTYRDGVEDEIGGPLELVVCLLLVVSCIVIVYMVIYRPDIIVLGGVE